jgi:phosphoglucosamine mutase
MQEGGYNLGGEQSGHLIFSDHTTTGDGIIAALQVLNCMLTTGQPLSVLAGGMERFPQAARKVKVARKTALEEVPAMQEAIAAADSLLGDQGRTVVRYSGTEMVLRLMVEARDEDLVTEVLNQLEAAAVASLV